MTIIFYPDLPKEHNRVFQACKELGYSFHNNPKEAFDLAFYWSFNQTIHKPDQWLRNRKNIVNRGCFDITKSRVAQHFKSGLINPETHTGLAVMKSEKQARHDGRIIQCPTKRQNGYVYQKAINTKKDGKFEDIRIFWSGKIDMVVKKLKTSQFKNEFKEVVLVDDCLSKDEIRMIEDGCRSFGLDFGELDALRDVDTGELFIIDINNVAGRGIFERFQSLWPTYLEQFKNFVEVRKNLNGFAIGFNTFNEIIKYKRVLELGSGKGSQAISKYCELTSVEDQGQWVVNYKGGSVYHAQIKNGWYDLEMLSLAIESTDYDLILMDGPAKSPRKGFFDNYDIFKKVPFIIDDTHRDQGKQLVKLFEEKGFKFRTIKECDKEAVIWEG